MKLTYRNLGLNSLIITIISLMLFSCNIKDSGQENHSYYIESGRIFATGFNIKYSFERSLEEEILNELNKFDLSLNPFKENSIITKVNNNEEVILDSFFVNVIKKSIEISEKTDGYFDITISPLINAWGFGFDKMDEVTSEAIDSLKEFVGYEKISLSENGEVVKTDPRVEINTSAIAKGYACDVIGDLLESYGVINYMVEIGGEVTARGVNEKGVCWRIGVDKPIDDSLGLQHDLQAILSLCDKALATSGNYRNYYVKDGKKYAHTIDPFTGNPSETDLLGVTVLADDCMTADAYATAFVAMGLEKSIEVAKNVPGLHYYFIHDNSKDGSFEITHSENFEQFFTD